jgi:hypothetical protein
MMNQIEKLKTAAHAATDALWRAEAIERDKQNATLIGKCFKYSNARGGCDERWWLYLKVTTVDDGNLRAFKFEQRPNETIEIEPSSFVYHGRSLGPDGWCTEIDPSEFDRELAKLRAKINGYLPPTQPELTE